MIKKRLLVFITLISMLVYTSCLKDVKDAVEDIDQRARCVEILGEFTTNGSDKTCAQQTTDIDNILRDCGEFLTQDQKDELNFAKENCSDG